MALAAGTRLGPYEILALIGAGGMGEVYRAKDTRLPREVAIKVLPSVLAADPDRVRRFEQEAQAIAALKDARICTLHDVGEHEGRRFLVMELVEGETLAQRLARGPLPLDQALRYGMDIASALDGAHRRGIIHRDLKPGNVMLTKTGIKLLDFGLAKLRPEPVRGETVTHRLEATVEGAVVGTLPYMAPEQVEGRTADARTDIWALGCVVYEMVAGRRPFESGTSAALMAAILEREPASLAGPPPAAPAQVDRLVRTCLAKDPDERWQSAADVARQLRWIQTDSATADGVNATKRGWVRWLAASIALGLTAALGVVALVPGRSPQPGPETAAGPTQFDIDVPESVSSISGLSVSPDGSRVSFVGANQLWVHDLTTNTARPLPNVKVNLASYPFWSPNGQYIAYFYGGMLKKVPAAGGIPQDICPAAEGRGGSWGVDDTVLVAPRFKSIFRVPAAGGTPVPVTAIDATKGEKAHMWPHFIDERRFTYWAHGPASNAPEGVGGLYGVVYVGSLDSSEPSRRIAALESEAYVSEGFMLAVSADFTLKAQRLASYAPEGLGEERPLARDIRWASPMAAQRDFAVSVSTLVYAVAGLRRSQFSTVDRDGRRLGTIGSPVILSDWALAPNDAKIAFGKVDLETRAGKIWTLDLLTGHLTQLTTALGDDRAPVWSPWSDQIIFTRIGPPGARYAGGPLYLKRLGRDGELPIGESSQPGKTACDWHGDGTVLFGMSPRLNFWRQKVAADAKPEIWFDSEHTHRKCQFSRNGRWVAYESEDQIWVRPYPEGEPVEQVSTAGGRLPRWRRDGNAIFYIENDTLMEVQLTIGATVKAGLPRNVFAAKNFLEGGGYAVFQDGKRFLVTEPVDPIPRPTITVVRNWTAMLAGKR